VGSVNDAVCAVSSSVILALRCDKEVHFHCYFLTFYTGPVKKPARSTATPESLVRLLIFDSSNHVKRLVGISIVISLVRDFRTQRIGNLLARLLAYCASNFVEKWVCERCMRSHVLGTRERFFFFISCAVWQRATKPERESIILTLALFTKFIQRPNRRWYMRFLTTVHLPACREIPFRSRRDTLRPFAYDRSLLN